MKEIRSSEGVSLGRKSQNGVVDEIEPTTPVQQMEEAVRSLSHACSEFRDALCVMGGNEEKVNPSCEVAGYGSHLNMVYTAPQDVKMYADQVREMVGELRSALGLY